MTAGMSAAVASVVGSASSMICMIDSSDMPMRVPGLSCVAWADLECTGSSSMPITCVALATYDSVWDACDVCCVCGSECSAWVHVILSATRIAGHLYCSGDVSAVCGSDDQVLCLSVSGDLWYGPCLDLRLDLR